MPDDVLTEKREHNRIVEDSSNDIAQSTKNDECNSSSKTTSSETTINVISEQEIISDNNLHQTDSRAMLQSGNNVREETIVKDQKEEKQWKQMSWKEKWDKMYKAYKLEKEFYKPESVWQKLMIIFDVIYNQIEEVKYGIQSFSKDGNFFINKDIKYDVDTNKFCYYITILDEINEKDSNQKQLDEGKNNNCIVFSPSFHSPQNSQKKINNSVENNKGKQIKQKRPHSI